MTKYLTQEMLPEHHDKDNLLPLQYNAGKCLRGEQIVNYFTPKKIPKT